LGPTFIKVGQSLSIRTDLLRPAYIEGLTKLQDRVPAFPTAAARETIESELGRPIEEVFSSGLEPSASVVAAASLGQVYKAILRADGSEVGPIRTILSYKLLPSLIIPTYPRTKSADIFNHLKLSPL
jgi:predicted unusual protein kinase regulating ubiquinone biosynthesis (AarF/ABC1/UbiB family)